MQAVCLQCPESSKRYARTRGLCRRCYQRCCKAVREQRTTWADLEREGRALPSRTRAPAWKRSLGAGSNEK
jgi:hypothetical protein